VFGNNGCALSVAREKLMPGFVQDLRYAVRTLLASRGFAAIAALTLAAGIGANTAIFGIIDAVLLRPLPYHNPDRVVRLYEIEAAPGKYPIARPNFIDWKTQNSTFSDMTLFSTVWWCLKSDVARH
jgi:putative ABC transport system permease protein